MRWRVLVAIGRWQLLLGRCPHCGWPKLAIVHNDIMREWPQQQKQRKDGG